MSLTGSHMEEAERKLRELAEEEKFDKQIKDKIKNISKQINEKLKDLEAADAKIANSSLTNINSDYLPKYLLTLEAKNLTLIEAEEKLKSDKERLNRERMNSIDDKSRFENSIKDIKNTIVKIQKAIDESVEEETGKRKKTEEDFDKSINQIKDKIKVFQEESKTLEEQNVQLRAKKQEILDKISGLQTNFRAKAEEKDESVKKEKEELMEDLKKVQEQVNEVTELNKVFGALEKSNFDNKLSLYMKTKKFPDLINHLDSSANSINMCKQELTKGVNRLTTAAETKQKNELRTKELNDEFLAKFKVQGEKEEALKKLKAQKDEIRSRILQLQSLKKQKQEGAATTA